LIFCITGMPGSGKSVVSEAAKSVGIKVVSMGDVIREEAEGRGIEKSPSSIGNLMLQLRNEEGKDAVAKRCLKKALGASPDSIIEGVRSLEELDYFRSQAEVCLIAVHASPRTRFERLLKRGRSDDPKDWETFRERDMRELKVGIGSVIAMADKVFINEGSLPDLGEAVKEFFRGMKNASFRPG